MKVLEISTNGKYTKKDILRKNVSETLNIHIRDLRPVFLARQVATIFTRSQSIIINLGKLKLIVTRDKISIFNLENPWILKTFIPDILKEIPVWNKKATRFEFWALEFVLVYKMRFLRKSYTVLENEGNRILKVLNTSFDDVNLEKLLSFRKKLLKFEINLKENKQAIVEILEDEDDLQNLYFSSQKNKNFEEVESILESFLEQAEEMANHVDEIQENLNDTQEIIQLKMNNRRNLIIRFDLIVSLVTTILTMLTVVSGIYGMNLKNNMENDFSAFIWIIAAMWICAILFFLGSFIWLKKKKII